MSASATQGVHKYKLDSQLVMGGIPNRAVIGWKSTAKIDRNWPPSRGAKGHKATYTLKIVKFVLTIDLIAYTHTLTQLIDL